MFLMLNGSIPICSSVVKFSCALVEVPLAFTTSTSTKYWVSGDSSETSNWFGVDDSLTVLAFVIAALSAILKIFDVIAIIN